MSLVGQPSVHGLESILWRGHIDTCDLHDISWRALSSDGSSSDDPDLPWHVTDGNLIRWLLHLDLLEADELALLYLEDEITLDHVLHTFLRGALDLWSELLSVDDLVDLESASIAGVDCHLHARLNVAASGDDTLDGNETAHGAGLDLPQLGVVLLARISSWHNREMVTSLELWRNSHLGEAVALWLLSRFDQTLIDHVLLSICRIVPPLLHHDIKGAEIFFAEI